MDIFFRNSPWYAHAHCELDSKGSFFSFHNSECMHWQSESALLIRFDSIRFALHCDNHVKHKIYPQMRQFSTEFTSQTNTGRHIFTGNKCKNSIQFDYLRKKFSGRNLIAMKMVNRISERIQKRDRCSWDACIALHCVAKCAIKNGYSIPILSASFRMDLIAFLWEEKPKKEKYKPANIVEKTWWN